MAPGQLATYDSVQVRGGRLYITYYFLPLSLSMEIISIVISVQQMSMNVNKRHLCVRMVRRVSTHKAASHARVLLE
jgi:hypothetical protein